MSSTGAASSRHQHTVIDPAPHDLHECRDAETFRARFEEVTRCPVEHVADDIVARQAPKAIFAVGSLPLGMATSGSDVDLIVLVDDNSALLSRGGPAANSGQQLEFANESDLLLAGEFASLRQGVLVDIQIAVTPEIQRIYKRLRRRGPQLSESEIRTLGRLSSGWLLWQSERYLEERAVSLNDSALAIYCCTKHFVAALINRRKAARSLKLDDIPLALQLGRSSVELTYLAYFASEGFPYLGSKWLAKLGHAHDAQERLDRHPLLKSGKRLLFPNGESNSAQVNQYLHEVDAFLASMRALIEQKLLFKIAFSACPQISAS